MGQVCEGFLAGSNVRGSERAHSTDRSYDGNQRG